MANDRKTSPCKVSKGRREDRPPSAAKQRWPKDETVQELDVENRELKKALHAQADEINRLKNNIARREQVTQRHLSSLGKNGAGVRGLIAAHIRLEEKAQFLEEKLREEHLKVVQERDLAEYFKAQLQSLREQFKVRVQSKAGGLAYKLAENRLEKGLDLISDLRHLHDVNAKLEKKVQGLQDELRELHSQSAQPSQPGGRGESRRELQTSSSSRDAPPVLLESLDHSVSIASNVPPEAHPGQEGNSAATVALAEPSQLWKEVSTLRAQLQGSREELKRTVMSHDNLLRDHEELTLTLGDERGRNREFSSLQNKLKLVQYEVEDQKMRLESLEQERDALTKENQILLQELMHLQFPDECEFQAQDSRFKEGQEEDEKAWEALAACPT